MLMLFRVNWYSVDEVMLESGVMMLCQECAILHEDMVDFSGYGSGEHDEVCDLCNQEQEKLTQLSVWDYVRQNPV